ncbi:hypothetical protein T459_28979 [Capsicum annuum]|uniref:Uncharacterized protein n=1 Tax=Capsicum annuum TaxID=4072 RepID=A0A2G2YIB4_CAPAN|nr:hypothetical protein FXO37_16387 [Capsicum annuum]PHT69492.1 hypothetical protein T459_28979 [Capsicum annuum]
MFKFSFLTAVHQNSTRGAAENIGTAAKPNGIMHEPVCDDRPNAFSNNSSSVLSYRAAVENVFNLKGIRYFGHCISYAVVASVLLGAAVSWHLSVTEPLAARQDALQSTVIRLKEGFHRKDQNSSGINSDKSIDNERPSLALRSSSCHSVVQEPEVGSSYIDRNLEHNSSLVVCSRSGLESQGGDSSTSTSANQQILT